MLRRVPVRHLPGRRVDSVQDVRDALLHVQLPGHLPDLRPHEPGEPGDLLLRGGEQVLLRVPEYVRAHA